MGKKKKAADRLVAQNAAKTLFANIRFASVDNPIRSLVLTSSVPNEGKTTVSMQLAAAIAQSGKRVLLVEVDMRRRSLADMLGVGPTSQGFDFLDSEPHIPNPVDILASKRFAGLVDGLSRDYDFVVYDTPPVGTFVDAAVLSTLVDATALIVRENFARRDEVANAYEQLRKADANVIGAVMNYCETETSEYYYAYYNKEGKRVKEHDAAAEVAASPAVMPSKRGARSHAAMGPSDTF